MCSLLGQEARGITGGSTDKRSSGRVPDILGLFDFGLSPKSLSMIISGCNQTSQKHVLNQVTKIHGRKITFMCGIIDTCDDDVEDERFSSILSNLAISASSVAISLRYTRFCTSTRYCNSLRSSVTNRLVLHSNFKPILFPTGSVSSCTPVGCV